MDLLDDFSAKLLIVVTTYNRAKATELTLNNLIQTRRKAALWVLDDQSTEYDIHFLKKAALGAERVEQREKNLGVDRQRFLTQLEALNTDFKYIYHTDNDAIHDSNWIARLYQIHSVFAANPICLYNTVFHVKHTIKLIEQMALAARKYCPGISFFYPQDLIRPNAKLIEELFNTSVLQTNWDFYFGHLIGAPTLTSLVSFVEHFGAQGLHNNDFERDRALSPTPELMLNRQKIIDLLSA